MSDDEYNWMDDTNNGDPNDDGPEWLGIIIITFIIFMVIGFYWAKWLINHG